MRLLAVALLIALAGCDLAAPAEPVGPTDVQGWRLASGKRPSRAEHAAMVAACQDGAVRAGAGQPLDSCLADLGLHRAE